MKLRSLMTISAALLLSAGAARAAHVWEDPGAWWGSIWTYDTKPVQRFTAQELSFDLFASYTDREREFDELFKTDIKHGHWGGGVGLNYFFLRNLGLSADINMPNDGGNLVNDVIGNIVFRVPIESIGLAPYIFGGGGRTTDQVWDWVGDVGVGLDFRLNPASGLFIDSRYIWGNKTSDAILFRAGIRLVF